MPRKLINVAFVWYVFYAKVSEKEKVRKGDVNNWRKGHVGL